MSRELLEPAPVSALERQLLSAGGSISQDKPKIGPIGASPLLSQLKQFLPKMEQANAELQQKLQEVDPSELDIEHIPEQQGEGAIIQMDLACGLLELRDEAAVAAAQRAIAAGTEVAVDTYEGGSSSGSDSDSDSESDSGSDSGSRGSEGYGEGSMDDPAAAAAAVRCSSRGTAAAAAAAADANAMEEDTEAAAAAAAAAAKAVQKPAEAQPKQQQQQVKQRRKLKPKRPMIEEL